MDELSSAVLLTSLQSSAPTARRRFSIAQWRNSHWRVRLSRLALALFAGSSLISPPALAGAALGTNYTRAQLDYFESQVRPILVNNCYKCHSSRASSLKGGFSLEFRDTLLEGGDHGPVIVPGNPDASALVQAVRYTNLDLQMPPDDNKLTDAQIAALVNWVRMGAPDPRTADLASTNSNKDPLDHWSFKPLTKVSVPAVNDTNWAANPIDAFIYAKLDENGMKPSAPADKQALIRRATYDLTGLPPTQGEVQSFLADDSTNAFAKVVDRLLASPQYGERWGRYWLDVARYADTKGEVNGRESPYYPYAWTYRDYVVKSFNQDKPYNQFILEQLAADKLPLDSVRSSLAALGFLTLGNHFNGNQNDMINDRIDVVCKGTMALTVTCARCHDHKFDPISQKDYYALHGVFASSVEPAEEPVIGAWSVTPAYTEYVKKRVALQEKIDSLEKQIQAGQQALRRGALAQNRGATPPGQLTPAQMRRGQLARGQAQPMPQPQMAVASMPPAQMASPTPITQQAIQQLRREQSQARHDLDELELNEPAAPPRATILVDSPRPKDSPVFLRGQAETRGPIVPRRFIIFIAGSNAPAFHNGSGRLELALDIVSRSNPLTARVMVNRIWMHHFDQGIVATPDDFGNQSDPPTHQELLDYLAVRFMDDGWSVKKLHRLIMLSRAYQQSSETNPRYAQLDPMNHLLWRANIHRLEFEAVRDSILTLGDQLDLTLGGRPVNLGEEPGSRRRTLYGYIDRLNLPEIYNQFDFANPDLVTGRRYEAVVPQQALFMMNSPIVVEAARHLVNEPAFVALPDNESRVHFLYERIFQREPTDVETKLGVAYVDESPPPEMITTDNRQYMRGEMRGARGPVGATTGPRGRGQAMSLAGIVPGQLRAVGSWAKYAHALLQTNEALFVD